MKIRLFIALAIMLAVLGFSTNFNRTESASEFNAKCRIATFEEALQQSKAVFLGEVIEEEKQGDTRIFNFRVEKYWKGANQKNIKISVYETSRYQAWFKEGGKYLVYAFEGEEGILRVGRCSRSNDAENSKEDLQKLGKGKIPR